MGFREVGTPPIYTNLYNLRCTRDAFSDRSGTVAQRRLRPLNVSLVLKWFGKKACSRSRRRVGSAAISRFGVSTCDDGGGGGRRLVDVFGVLQECGVALELEKLEKAEADTDSE